MKPGGIERGDMCRGAGVYTYKIRIQRSMSVLGPSFFDLSTLTGLALA